MQMVVTHLLIGELINGNWYYFDSAGWMVTGWQWVGDKCYYLTSSGAMAVDTLDWGILSRYIWSMDSGSCKRSVDPDRESLVVSSCGWKLYQVWLGTDKWKFVLF